MIAALIILSSLAAAPTLSCAFHEFEPEQLASASDGLSHDAMARMAAAIEGVDGDVFYALVAAESSFDPGAKGTKGEVGLTQLMPATAEALLLTPETAPDPMTNLLGGACYLRHQIDRFPTLAAALAAYNAGPSRAARAPGSWPISTRSYVSRILSRLGRSSEIPPFGPLTHVFASLDPSDHGFVGGIAKSAPPSKSTPPIEEKPDA